MFVPGHKQKMIDKAVGLKADVLIFDLEDGVPPTEVDRARKAVGTALGRSPAGPTRFVRTHGPRHAGMDADLQAVVRPGLQGLMVPKIEQPDDVLKVDRLLEKREAQAGLAPGSVPLLATIESARGVVQAPAIAASCPRLIGLMFGAEDFALDLGLFSPGVTEDEMLYARSALVVAAASARLEAVDKVYPDIRDRAGLARETRKARQLGFTGKALIHPAQIGTVHRVFSPTQEEVEYARRVVAAFEAAPDEGAIAVDERLVDLPVVERARRILQWREEES